MTKTDLRQLVTARVHALNPIARAAAAESARNLLRRQSIWRQAKSVLFYAPMPSELDIWPLLGEALAERKLVTLPRFSAETGRYLACQVEDLSRDVATGRFGIREPLATCREIPCKLDLILVPGVAFDCHCRRLGRGKGFYDRLLAAVEGITCGIAFEEQIVPEVPVEPHDVVLNCIVTPTRWLQRSSARGPE